MPRKRIPPTRRKRQPAPDAAPAPAPEPVELGPHFHALLDKLTEPPKRLLHWMGKLDIPNLAGLKVHLAGHRHPTVSEISAGVQPGESDCDRIADLLKADYEREHRPAGSATPKPARMDKGRAGAKPRKRVKGEILQALGNEQMRGPEIAKKAGYSYDYVRQVLPQMCASALLEKTANGYRRTRKRTRRCKRSR